MGCFPEKPRAAVSGPERFPGRLLLRRPPWRGSPAAHRWRIRLFVHRPTPDRLRPRWRGDVAHARTHESPLPGRERARGVSRLVPLAQALSLDTLPALRQEVHTFRRLLVPLIMVRTDWMFGFQRREWRRCEWDTVLPKFGPLAQMSHVEATVVS